MSRVLYGVYLVRNASKASDAASVGQNAANVLARRAAGKLAEVSDQMGLVVVTATVSDRDPARDFVLFKNTGDAAETNDSRQRLGR